MPNWWVGLHFLQVSYVVSAGPIRAVLTNAARTNEAIWLVNFCITKFPFFRVGVDVDLFAPLRKKVTCPFPIIPALDTPPAFASFAK